MTHVLLFALALAASATIEVPAGAPLAAAIARARPGDLVRLGPGTHRGGLGRLAGVAIEGAGAGRTEVVAPEGEDGAVATGEVSLSGLALRAGPARSALKVLGGSARLADVVLDGGSCGAFVDEGRLDARDVDLVGGAYGLLARRGDVAVDGGSARGGEAGVGVLAGRVSLARLAITGPSREAGLSVAGGTTTLFAVTVRAPGPSGISASAGAVLEGRDVTVSGATEQEGFLGDCVQARRATVRLRWSALLRCGGAALEASGGTTSLVGVDAGGGAAGCLVFMDGGEADLDGNLCTGRGPALVVASGAKVRARMNRWRADPAAVVDCASGARLEVGPGERIRQPCRNAP